MGAVEVLSCERAVGGHMSMTGDFTAGGTAAGCHQDNESSPALPEQIGCPAGDPHGRLSADVSTTAAATTAVVAAAHPGADPNAGQCPEGPRAHAGEDDPERHAQLVIRMMCVRGGRQVLRHGRIMARPHRAAAGRGTCRSHRPRSPGPSTRAQACQGLDVCSDRPGAPGGH